MSAVRPAQFETTPDLTADQPYAGLAPFEERHREYFHGRATAISALERLVERNALVVLYGASGLGKTSLLMAGVFPELRDSDYFPIRVRPAYSSGGADLTANLLEQVRAEASRTNVDIQSEAVEAPEGKGADVGAVLAVRRNLWGFFQTTRFWSPTNRLLTPILVLDQFEELFTLGRGDIRTREFALALADLIDGRVPQTLLELFRTGAFEPPASRTRARAKCVIALREDFLPDFESLCDVCPGLRGPRYRLGRLVGPDAVSAICDPNKDLVTNDVAHAILRYLARENRSGHEKAPESVAPESRSFEVEPALLSLFCHGLNERRMRAAKRQIDLELVQSSSGLIVQAFYESCISRVDPGTREFVERDLITTSGYRTTVAISNALEHGATEVSIKQLVESRLLRIEERFGEPHVELIHDVLTGEIRQIRQTRLESARVARRRHRTIQAVVSAAVVVFATGAAATTYVSRVTLPEREKAGQRAGRMTLLSEQLATAAAKAANFDAQSIVDCTNREQELNRLKAGAPPGSLGAAEENLQKCKQAASTRIDELTKQWVALETRGNWGDALLRRVEASMLRGDAEFKERHLLPGRRLVQTLRGHKAEPRSVAFGSSGVAFTLGADAIRIWDKSGRPVRELTISGYVPRRLHVSESGPDELLVAVFGKAYEEGAQPKPNKAAEKKSTSLVALWVASKASGSSGQGWANEIRALKYETSRTLHDAVVLQNREVITGFDGLVRLQFDASGQPVASRPTSAETSAFYRLIVDNDGTQVAGLGVTRTSAFALEWSPAATIYTASLEVVADVRPVKGRGLFVRSGTLSPQGDAIVLGLSSGPVLRAPFHGTAREIYNDPQHDAVAVSLDYCRERNEQLIAGIDKKEREDRAGKILVLGADKSAVLFEAPGVGLNDAALAPDCSHVISAWTDNLVRVIATNEGKEYPVAPNDLLQDLKRRLGY